MSLLSGIAPMLLLKSTLLLLCGFLASRVLSRSQASARHLVWSLMFLGLLALPLAGSALPTIELAWLPAGAGEASGFVAPDASTSSTRTLPNAGRTGAEQPDLGMRGEARPGFVEDPSLKTQGPGPRREIESGGRAPWAAHGAAKYLVPTYLLGGLLVIAYLAIGLLRVAWITHRADPIDENPDWRILLRTPETSGGASIRIRRSRDVEVPFTWGFFRPTILLPWEAERWPETRKRDALVHELSHVERRDWVVQLLVRLVCAAYWFHPLVWIASRRLFLEAERTCDDRVLAAGARSSDYAQHLLELTAGMHATRGRLAGAVAMARRSQLPVRIEAILDDHLTRSTMSLRKKLLITMIIVSPALVIASSQLTQAGPAIDSSTPAGVDIPSVQHAPDGWRAERSASGDAPPSMNPGGAPDSGPGSPADASGDENAGRREATSADTGRHGGEGRDDADRDPLPGRSYPDADARGDSYSDPGYIEDSDRMTPLMIAAASGDLATARALVDRRNGTLDVNEGVPGIGTPLILAVSNGHHEMVRFLLDRRADPNGWDTSRHRGRDLPRSPLAAAARGGHLEIAELLLDRGARPNDVPLRDASPLMQAAQRGLYDMSLLLLNRGADVNQELRGDGTPLISAAAGGNPQIVELFLDRGADPRAGIRGDGNPIIAAARRGDTELVRLLLDRGADPDDWVSGDESGFFHALRFGDEAMIRAMIDAGADVNAKWRGDGSPLIIASQRGEPRIVEALLDAGADPGIGVRGDGSPLIQAAARGDARLVARLVENGADVNEPVPGDGSPLIAAAKSGKLDVVRFLVAAGADVNQIVPGDENPLMAASEMGHLETVRYLVERGADINVKVREHGEVRTALSMARRGGSRDVIDYLISKGARE